MILESQEHLDKAREFLAKADDMLANDWPDEAGRAAYLAGFHAAKALIATRTGRDVKSHKGTHVEFARLTRNESGLDAELRRFLPHAYDLKTVADYETGAAAGVSPENARAAIKTARRLVDAIAGLLT